MVSRQRHQRTILWVLAAGFALFISLLIAIGYFGVRSLDSIRDKTGALVDEQLMLASLVDAILREQRTLSLTLHELGRGADAERREWVLDRLNEADDRIFRAVQEASGRPDRSLWLELRSATQAFSREARASLRTADTAEISGSELLRRHRDVVSAVARLTAARYDNAKATHARIEDLASDMIRRSHGLLGACVLIAVLSGVAAVRLVRSCLRKTEWQGSELSCASWQMLERQETAARCFSHRLHNELGQSLSAVKTNLVALAAAGFDSGRASECMSLVGRSLENVRELAEILHPVILDDFGLDPALQWLCRDFHRRTKIETKYHSGFSGRLPERTEVHLFRLAQEALADVERRSGATWVSVRLACEGPEVVLSIADDGRVSSASARITGMRERARCAGGEFKIIAVRGKGARVEARVPTALICGEGARFR